MTTKNSQILPIKQSIEALFASKARAEILRLFLLDPSRAYYQRQVEGATGLAIRAVQRELERLTEIGLLYRREEGNRAYYQVDTQFPLYPELRAMLIKAGGPVDALRARLALEPGVRLAFLHERDAKALVVMAGTGRPVLGDTGPYAVETMSSEVFLKRLSEDPKGMRAYLEGGADLLGRRDDVIWRRIALAGFDTPKARGVV